jgi:aspartyl/asparaginyl beta-hydroxylase (cupin superfamily)
MDNASRDDERIRGLAAASQRAAIRGNRAEAVRLLKEAERIAPNHPLMLNEAALRTLRAGNTAAAIAALEAIAAASPQYGEVWFSLGLARRAAGEPEAALAALDCALAVEPRNLAVLLEKASIQEQQGDMRAAAITYFAFLQQIPPGFDPPPAMAQPLEHARRAVEINNRALEAFVESGLAPIRARHAGETLSRFDRCVDLILRKQRVYTQQPTFMYFPGLPAIEFYDRGMFPWLEGLEAAAGDIRAELIDVLADRGVAALEPYVRGAAGPHAAAGGRQWRSYPFWRDGLAIPEHMARCRRTMKAINACPIWDAPGMGPNAMFSILDPRTRIPAHTGTANTRLVAHLPLIVPPACGFRVGGETREWAPGEAFVFDDTIDHEAWNDSDAMRAILIVDVWSPLIRPAERELVRALSARMSEYYGPRSKEPDAGPAPFQSVA